VKSYAIVFLPHDSKDWQCGSERFATVAVAAAIAYARCRRSANAISDWRVVETEDPANVGKFRGFWRAYDCSFLCCLAGGLTVLIFLLWQAWQANLIMPVSLGILAVVCGIATASRKGEDFQGDRGLFVLGAVILLTLAVFLFGVWSGRHEQWSYQVGCNNGDRYSCRHLVP
jgi:hypothetical protein